MKHLLWPPILRALSLVLSEKEVNSLLQRAGRLLGVTGPVCGGARIGASLTRWFSFCQTLIWAERQGLGILERQVGERPKAESRRKKG